MLLSKRVWRPLGCEVAMGRSMSHTTMAHDTDFGKCIRGAASHTGTKNKQTTQFAGRTRLL